MTVYDVVIVGGGAAGLSAALVLGRARRTVAVVDAGSPRNAPAEHMQGFLSRDGLSPLELLSLGRAEVAKYGVEVLSDRVESVTSGFYVRLASGAELRARRLLFATGVVDQLPPIPGLAEQWGRDVHVCPYCHGWEVRDQPIGVLASLHHALLLRQWSPDVTFFPHTTSVSAEETAQLEARGVRIVPGEVSRVVLEDSRVVGVELSSGEVVPRSAIFLAPRYVSPARTMLEGLGCELDEAGFPRTDETGRTTAFGVWAAGNASNPMANVIASAAAGSTAAAMINGDLVHEDTDRALETLAPA
jgi:thioredoxin reductase